MNTNPAVPLTKRHRGRIFFTGIALLALLLGFTRELPAESVGGAGLKFPAPGSYALPRLKPAADGEVLTVAGQPAKLHSLFDGKILLLSFIYTHCADGQGCPWASAILKQVATQLAQDPALKQRARLLSLSFDPTRDTPEVMREYGAHFSRGDEQWLFLTTRSEGALRPILDGYDQTLEKEYNERGKATGGFAHLLRVYLIDRDKQIRNIYSASLLDAELLVNDIKTLVLEEKGGMVSSKQKPPGFHGPGDFKQGYESADYQTRSLALNQRAGRETDLLKFTRQPPLGLPLVPVPEDNPLTAAKVALGRKLFYDRRLSLNNTLSCAMCHIPEQGFTSNEMATSVGIEGRTVRRNAPTLYNVGYQSLLFHDGRETTLETQVWSPILAANEMAAPSAGWLVDKVRNLPDYGGLFEGAFDRGVSMERIGQAIASYERTLVSGNSPFDRWRYGKELGALTPEAQRGFRLFTGKAGCGVCHLIGEEHALFTDHKLHGTGIGWRNAMGGGAATIKVLLAPGVEVEMDRAAIESVGARPEPDLGRYEVTQNPADRWLYKTPSLRNIALTASYMHDGSLASLEAVVEFYDRGGYPGPHTDPLIQPLQLNTQEKSDLVSFLKSLTGSNVEELVADAFAAPVGDPDE
jgi:cytochrome c peroxidase